MNLQPVKVPPHFRYTCMRCRVRRNSDQHGAVADLDGTPWQAYYCAECARFPALLALPGGHGGAS